MSKQCEIIQDLLPLYVDGICSNSSEELVKEHLKNCTACNELYQKMCYDIGEKMLKSEKDNIITHHKRKENQKIIKYIFFAIAILYIPTLFIVSAFADGDATFISIPYIFALAVLAIYTLPFYFAFIELGLAICRVLEKKRTNTMEKVLNIIGIVLALGMVLITVIAYAFELSELVLLLLAVAVLLALKWIVTAIICKKKPDFSIMKQKTFWLCAVILAVTITVIIIATSVFLASQNRRGDFTKVEYSIGYRDSGTEYEGLYFDIDDYEQHSWNVIDTFTVKWVNTTENNINYSTKCYVYKKTNDGWGLCSNDYIDFSEDIFTVPAKSVQTHVYSIEGYEIKESGRYKFVTFVDKKAVWVEFDVTIEILGS